jgi:hypothetical protein
MLFKDSFSVNLFKFSFKICMFFSSAYVSVSSFNSIDTFTLSLGELEIILN